MHPNHRAKGLGTLLLEETLRYANSENAKSLTLEVRESNIKAINLYQKFGFVEVGKRPGYYADDRETAIIMERRAPARLL